MAQTNTRVLGEKLTNPVSWSHSRGLFAGGSSGVVPATEFGASSWQPMFSDSVVPPPRFQATRSGRQTDWAATKGSLPLVYVTSVGFDCKQNVNGLFTTVPPVCRISNIKQAGWETHGFVPLTHYMTFARQHVAGKTLNLCSHKTLSTCSYKPRASIRENPLSLIWHISHCMQTQLIT